MKFFARFALVLGLMAAVTAARADDTYVDDAQHSRVAFEVTHMVINTVVGTFTNFSAKVTYDPVTKQLTGGEASIEVKSVDTGIEKRDNHLRSPDFFDAAKYPTMTFKATKVIKDAGQDVLIGDFTIRDVTKQIKLPVTVKGPIVDPWGNTRIGIEATTTISRKDWGLTWNKTMETGGVVVSDEVKLVINMEMVKQK